jgi:hypothetical protein
MCRLHERDLPASTCLIWFTKFASCAPSGVAFTILRNGALDSVPSVLGSASLSLFVYNFGLHPCVPRAQATATPSMPVPKFVT